MAPALYILIMNWLWFLFILVTIIHHLSWQICDYNCKPATLQSRSNETEFFNQTFNEGKRKKNLFPSPLYSRTTLLKYSSTRFTYKCFEDWSLIVIQTYQFYKKPYDVVKLGFQQYLDSNYATLGICELSLLKTFQPYYTLSIFSPRTGMDNPVVFALFYNPSLYNQNC